MTDNLIKNSAYDNAGFHAQAFDTEACFAANWIKCTWKTVGLGLPGTAQERVRALMIKQALEANLGPVNGTWVCWK